MLSELFDHLAWADARAREALAAMPAGSPQRERALRIHAHLAAAEHVWLSRLEGRVPEHAVWPALEPDAATALARESAARLSAYVRGLGPGDLAREVTYRNSAGQEFLSCVEDVLAQVALHGSYHRGQLALLARDAGAQPAVTDYIVFVRGATAPPQAPPVGGREPGRPGA